MEVVSWQFLVFVLAVLAVYYLLDRRAQNIWLLAASATFMTTHGWQNLIPLAGIAVISFTAGKRFAVSGDRRWIAGGTAATLSALVIYRVAASRLFPLPEGITALLLPLGVSFYALQAISYLLDLGHRKIEAETNPVDFTLYLLFFPKILAGPIERPGHFLPQMKHPRTVDNTCLNRAFSYLLFGLFRKAALAEVLLTLIPKNILLTPISDLVFFSGMAPMRVSTFVTPVSNVDRLLGAAVYGIYLYNDFAGYTLIMRGISLLMGFELSPNFREPFFSTTLSEFWSRWHISLSSWLRDYLYFPLTRLLKRKLPDRLTFVVILPLLATMLAAGFWHGLTVPFILWGLFFGLVMSVEQLVFLQWPKIKPQGRSKGYRFFWGFVTFWLVSLSWIFFSAASWQEISAYFSSLFLRSAWGIQPGFSMWAGVLVLVSFLLDFGQAAWREEAYTVKWPLAARSALLAIMLIILFLAFTWTSPYTSSVFIYQAF